MRNIFALLFLLLTVTGFSQSNKRTVLKTVSKNTLESHLRFLSDDLLEGRAAGTRGNKVAASYIANQFVEYGVQPIPNSDSYFQKFQLKQTKAPTFVRLNLNDVSHDQLLTFSMPAIDTSGDAIFLNYGTESDFNGIDLQGKAVVVHGGTKAGQGARAMFMSGKEKKKIALEQGAVGMIELVSFDEAMWGNLQRYMASQNEVVEEDAAVENSEFFHLWINIKDTASTPKKLDVLNYKLASDGKSETLLKTQNVVGIIKGTDDQLKNEYVIYSAHYDHVGIGRPDATGDSIYNGARDNNIGVTGVLSMAENLGRYPTKRSALFILFTAEEMGLLGSEYYVNHPVVPLDKMVYCFNTDGGGYNNTSLATIIGLERTSAKQHFEKAVATFGLTASGDPAPEQNLFDRSDNVHFAKKGIPAPTYTTGFDAFDEEITKYYHQPGDEADSLDFDYLLKYYQGYVLSGRLIANDKDMPTWVTGDKYEAAWKELHGK